MGKTSFNLQRFVMAQEPIYASVCRELADGKKASHWMWFVFPQLMALGRSETARYFGISSFEEALAYWQHPVLGKRLKDCTALVLAANSETAHDIFGSPDDLKFRSCMTLFEKVAPEEGIFGQALDRFCAGHRDETTLELIRPE